MNVRHLLVSQEFCLRTCEQHVSFYVHVAGSYGLRVSMG